MWNIDWCGCRTFIFVSLGHSCFQWISCSYPSPILSNLSFLTFSVGIRDANFLSVSHYKYLLVCFLLWNSLFLDSGLWAWSLMLFFFSFFFKNFQFLLFKLLSWGSPQLSPPLFLLRILFLLLCLFPRSFTPPSQRFSEYFCIYLSIVHVRYFSKWLGNPGLSFCFLFVLEPPSSGSLVLGCLLMFKSEGLTLWFHVFLQSCCQYSDLVPSCSSFWRSFFHLLQRINFLIFFGWWCRISGCLLGIRVPVTLKQSLKTSPYFLTLNPMSRDTWLAFGGILQYKSGSSIAGFSVLRFIK